MSRMDGKREGEVSLRSTTARAPVLELVEEMPSGLSALTEKLRRCEGQEFVNRRGEVRTPATRREAEKKRGARSAIAQ